MLGELAVSVAVPIAALHQYNPPWGSFSLRVLLFCSSRTLVEPHTDFGALTARKSRAPYSRLFACVLCIRDRNRRSDVVVYCKTLMTEAAHNASCFPIFMRPFRDAALLLLRCSVESCPQAEYPSGT